jgi:hypothetical protein
MVFLPLPRARGRTGDGARHPRRHEAALAAAARDIFTPRTRPDISESYFGAMFHDLDGHRIEVKTREA